MAYCIRTSIEAIFGAINVAAWADLDDDQDDVKIDARITEAICYTADDIDNELRNGPYVLPLVTSAGVVPRTVTGLNAKLAGIWLYESRGVEDFDPDTGVPAHRLTFAKTEAQTKLRRIATRDLKIDAVLVVEEVPKVFPIT